MKRKRIRYYLMARTYMTVLYNRKFAVHLDPLPSEFQNMRDRSQFGTIRLLLDPKSLWAWDAVNGNHNDVAAELGLDLKQCVPLMFEDGVAQISETISYTVWKSNLTHAYEVVRSNRCFGRLGIQFKEW